MSFYPVKYYIWSLPEKRNDGQILFFANIRLSEHYNYAFGVEFTEITKYTVVYLDERKSRDRCDRVTFRNVYCAYTRTHSCTLEYGRSRRIPSVRFPSNILFASSFTALCRKACSAQKFQDFLKRKLIQARLTCMRDDFYDFYRTYRKY